MNEGSRWHTHEPTSHTFICDVYENTESRVNCECYAVEFTGVLVDKFGIGFGANVFGANDRMLFFFPFTAFLALTSLTLLKVNRIKSLKFQIDSKLYGEIF